MENYIVSVISAFVGYVSSRLASRESKGVLQTIGILFVLACLAVGLTLLGHWIVKPPQSAPNKLEGQWIERYQEEGKYIYAIATIRYNPESKHLEFSGNSYDSNLNFVGHWRTIQARLSGNQYDYLFEGESHNPDPTKRGLRKGVGGIWFDNPNHGVGNFFSVRADKELRGFELHKILDEEAATQSKNDSRVFIQRLNKDPSYFEKVTSTR